MAGIGFRLEKILSRDSYTNLLKGYSYSAIVSAGPLLCTIFSIALLTIIMPGTLEYHKLMVFRTLVVYIYAVSLVSTSPAQMIITRFMSDRIFLNDYKAIVPAFVGISILSLIFNAILGVILVPLAELTFAQTITSIVLFLCIGIIWIAMIVLSAAKEFIWIVKSFLTGALISVVAGFLMGKYFELTGILAGFTLGQAVLVVLLLGQIFTEFDYRKRVEFDFLTYFKKFTALAFIATFYNIGIWGDKFVFWFSQSTSQDLQAILRMSVVYDVPVFVAYILVVPTLAMFTVRVETGFYVHYKKYFLSILNKHPLSAIEERRQNIVNELKLGIGRLIVMQGTVTVIALLVAPKIYTYFGMIPINLGVFQITILSTFLQAMLQSLLIILLYFDLRMDALFMSATFAITNIIFSMISVTLGIDWYGYGYFASCFFSFLFGFFMLNYRMKHLIYYTFVSQKIIVHEEA